MGIKDGKAGISSDVNGAINRISFAVHNGRTFDDIFEIIFDQLKLIIPYDRIGLSTLDESGETLKVVKVKSARPIGLDKGFTCSIKLTSLGELLESRDKRVISDLAEYVKRTGHETNYNKMLLDEGIRSSLAIPLFVAGRPTGIMFFSSKEPNVYTREYLGEHFDVLEQFVESIKDHLAVALEKGMIIARLEETNRQLKELNAMKDEFLSIASHDLRSPLTSIILFGRSMQKESGGTLTDWQKRSLEIMTRSAEHLLTLVDDILNVAKMNSGRMFIEKEPTDIKAVLNESIAAMVFNAQNKNIDIKRESDFEKLEMMVDRSKMFQVFNNLIGNAIKFSPEGGSIHISERVDGNNYRFEIEDHGQGIAKEECDNIFEKFTQVGTYSAAKKEGSGLGLMICKKIVELHGGGIGVDSEPGKGSMFYFTLPVEKVGD
ncbi:MAG: ATP-binding protein [Nitrospinota bacterium]